VALKDFDETNPRTRDKNWKEDIPLADLPKLDEWYQFRIVGGVYSYAQHWIEFTNKEGQVKRYPVDCANWDPDKEAPSKQGGCPACEAGLRPSIKYLINVIDRLSQGKGDSDPIRALDIPPTVLRQLLDLKKLNSVKGEARSIAHPRFGCDVFMQKQRTKKRGGIEWQVQKGDRSPLSEEETSLELIAFDELWAEPDVHKIRADLTRHGYFDSDEKVPSKSKKSKKSEDDDDDDFEAPSSSRKSKKSYDDDDDEFEEPKKAKPKKPPVEDDDDEEEDSPPPKKAKPKKPPVDDDDDEFESVPPKKAKPKKPPVEDDDEDDDEDSPPPKKAKPKKPPVDEDDDEEFDDEFDV